MHNDGLEVVVGFGLTVGYIGNVYSSNQIPALLKFVSFTDGLPLSSRLSSKLAQPTLLL